MSRTVEIEKLKLSGSFRRRLKLPHVAKLAQTIDEVGLLHPPVVRESDLALVAGEDRVAALTLLGRTGFEPKWVECDDAMLAKIRRIENFARRHDPGEQQRLMVEAVEAAEAEELKAANPRAQEEHPKVVARDAKAKAVERVAAEKGVRPDSVRRALRREKEKLGELAEKPKQPFGAPARTLNATGELADQMAAIQGYIDAADKALQLAQGEITRLKNAGLPFPNARVERVYEAIHDAAAMVRANRPAERCPYCVHETPSYRCAACYGVRYICTEQVSMVPPSVREAAQETEEDTLPEDPKLEEARAAGRAFGEAARATDMQAQAETGIHIDDDGGWEAVSTEPNKPADDPVPDNADEYFDFGT